MRVVAAAVPVLTAVLVSLPFEPGQASAEETRDADQAKTAPDSGEPTLTPEAELRELNDVLQLTLPQQKMRARELIKKYPGTSLSKSLQRILNEYEVYNRIADAERQARDARTACYHAYWRDRCCPEPVWNPPLARLVNETNEPVLYEIRIGGIHKTLWMGPYRLRVGAGYASPHPYCVRYLGAGGIREAVISPGETYAFQGVPGDGTLSLVPTAAAPVGPGGSVAPPAPAAAPVEADPTSPSSSSEAGESPGDGPAMGP